MRRLFLCFLLLNATSYLFPQAKVSYSPANPRAGEKIIIHIDIDNPDASYFDMQEPVFLGPASFYSSSIKPLDIDSQRVEIIFIADAAGTLSLLDYGILYEQTRFAVERINIGIMPSSSIMERQSFGAFWVSPDDVLAFEPFILKIQDNEGRFIPITGFSIPGLYMEKVDEFELMATAISAESLALPALNIEFSGWNYQIDAKTVHVRALPQEAGFNMAYGQFSPSIEILNTDGRIQFGQKVFFRACVYGSGSVPWVKAPELFLAHPDGREVLLTGQKDNESAKKADSWEGSTCLLGSFLPDVPGVYSINMRPYLYFNSLSGTVNELKPPALVFEIFMPELPEWQPKEDDYTFILAEIEKLISGMDRGINEFSNGNWSELYEIFRIEKDRKSRLIAACSGLLSGKRLEALAILSSLEKAFYSPEGVSKLVAIAELSVGTTTPRMRLYSPCIFFCLALIFLIFSTVLFILGKKRVIYAGLLLIPALLALGALMFSFAERKIDYCLSTGAILRAVPSELADMKLFSEIGNVARIRKHTGEWLLVYTEDGITGWVSSRDVLVF